MNIGEIRRMFMLMSNKLISIDVIDINIGLDRVPHSPVSLLHLQLLLPDILDPLIFGMHNFFP